MPLPIFLAVPLLKIKVELPISFSEWQSKLESTFPWVTGVYVDTHGLKHTDALSMRKENKFYVKDLCWQATK